ncbi:MAG TPA: DMT family transporter, partial [Negativicutes bacterium]|nr:DMT family transporter [Negativicutes bacterium]
MKQLNRISGVIYVNLATLAWATNMVLGRWLKDAVGPITISSVRFFIASLIFAALLRKQPSEERHLGENRWLLVLMAVTGIVLFSPTLYWGLRYTTAVNCTLINALTPLVTGLFATWLIKERMSGNQIGGAVIAFAGMLVLISGGSAQFWTNVRVNAGDVIILAAVIVWGVYAVAGKQVMRQQSALSATAYSTFIGTPLLALLAVLELQSISANFTLEVVLSLLYIGVVPSAIGFYAWNAAVARLGPNSAAVFYNTLP